MNRLTLQASLIGLLTLLPASASGAAKIEVSDTVAGLGTEVEISALATNDSETAALVVTPPFGSEIILPVNRDTAGKATVKVSANDTQVAGSYSVELTINDVVDASATFTVLPESIDLNGSTLQADRTSLTPDGSDTVTVSVIARDRYGNTLSGRPMELISSRSADVISSSLSETDSSGEQTFTVTTTQIGSLSLRAMDLLSGKMLGGTVDISAGQSIASAGGYTAQQAAQYMPTSYAPMAYPTFGYMPYPMMGMNTYGGSYGSRITGNILGRTLYGQAGTFDVIAGFVIEGPKSMKPNEDATIRITAVDKNGSTVEDYMGLALLSSTDPLAVLPLNGEVQFQPQNLGQKVLTLGLRFRTPGEQILHMEDSSDPRVSGELTIMVAGEAGPVSPTLQITSPKANSGVKEPVVRVEGKGAPFINLIVTGGTEDVRGETSQDGNFSITIDLDPSLTDHTLRVRDDSGRYDSGNLHIRLDATPPEVGLVTFDPLSPQETMPVKLTVKSEPSLSSVKLKILEQDYPLTESKTASGTYEVTFPAPAAGTYQASVIASDSAENTVEVRSNITITKRTLPQVQNVKAEAKVDAVSLTWDPITSEKVDAYRVYVGEQPDNYLYTLETGQPTTTAKVAGLKAGVTYSFAVTALQGDRESGEKSEPATAHLLGMSMTVTPQDGALMLQWSNLPQETPLASYLLEYGVEADTFIEQRTINGDLRAYTLRDLLNGVTYYIRVTPVTTTGNVLRDLTVTASGTPAGSGSGFTTTTANPIPTDIGQVTPGSKPSSVPPISNLHGGAPLTTPTVGLPLSYLWIAVGVSALFFAWHWQRRKTLTQTWKFLQEMESRYHQQ
ncbi:hypothetical protein A2529_01730 [Candidatus Peribacteria bacterium RIFOXYD2_FULL_58_15]|nr:MAG: hypothetical protein A2529_01730 [Candidatus Peribacteria bacterium RIFOXYD2_FULL_58_15]